MGKVVNGKAVAVHALLFQNLIDSPKPNGAFWSIAIEWQIYFVFPLLLWLWRWAGGAAMLACTTLAVVGVQLAGIYARPLSELFGLPPYVPFLLPKLLHFIPQFLALFAFGVAAAHVLVAKGKMAKALWTATGAVMLLAIGLALGLCPPADIEAAFFWVDLLVGAAFAALFAGLAQQPGCWGARLLDGRLPCWLGQSSYSLYLTHVPVLELVFFGVAIPFAAGGEVRFLWLLALVVPTALVAARAFWWAFERPFLRCRSFRELFGAWPRPAAWPLPQPRGSENE